jgi:hypothetical protein
MTERPAKRTRQFPPGAGLLGLATLVAAASLSLAWPGPGAIYCDRLAPLAVLAMLAATLIALSFRSLAARRSPPLVLATLLLAAISLFASARFIARYHAVCVQLERQLHAPVSNPR